MTDLHGRRTFREVVAQAFADLGSRAKREDLIEGVKLRLTMAEYEDWREKAFRQAVLKATKSGRKVGVDAVYSTGDEVATLALFTPEEFEDKARQCARLSRSNRQTVFMLAEQCELVHGQSFDAERVIAEAKAA